MSHQPVTFGKRNAHLAQQSIVGRAPVSAPGALKHPPMPSYQSLLAQSEGQTATSAIFNTPQGATAAEMERFIGPTWPKFQSLWEDMQTSPGIKISLSIPLFFTSVPWLFYRKQYALGLILAVATAFAPLVIEGGEIYCSIAFGLVLALFGESFIVQNAMSKIAKIKAKGMSPEATALKIEATGGTSWANALVLLIVVGVALFSLGGTSPLKDMKDVEDITKTLLQVL